MKKMLLVMAHPDDESFACGGTVAKYVKAGWEVELVCATRGEVGNSGPHEDVTPEQLGEIRQKEVEAAAAILGISSITFLGYKDGTLKDEPAGELEEKIHDKMLEFIPDCVITFDTTGISNHPDHIRMCFATTFAFQKYAFWIHDALVDTQEYTEEQAPKLYYACVPESTVSYLQKKRIFPQESFGRPWVGTEDKKVTTVIGLDGVSRTKKKALLAHVSQEEDVERFLSLSSHPLLKQEYFICRMHGTREVFMGNNDRVATKL